MHIAAMVPIKPLIHLVNMGTIKLLRKCNYGYHLVAYILQLWLPFVCLHIVTIVTIKLYTYHT